MKYKVDKRNLTTRIFNITINIKKNKVIIKVEGKKFAQRMMPKTVQ